MLFVIISSPLRGSNAFRDFLCCRADSDEKRRIVWNKLSRRYSNGPFGYRGNLMPGLIG
jgi:hypothetical protein